MHMLRVLCTSQWELPSNPEDSDKILTTNELFVMTFADVADINGRTTLLIMGLRRGSDNKISGGVSDSHCRILSEYQVSVLAMGILTALEKPITWSKKHTTWWCGMLLHTTWHIPNAIACGILLPTMYKVFAVW